MITTKNLDEIWTEISAKIRSEFTEETYNLWLKPIKPVRWENNLLTLLVPNHFYSGWIEMKCKRKIESLLQELSGEECAIGFEVTQEITPILESEEARTEPVATPAPETQFSQEGFNPKYTFESFVVGPSNRFAQAAAEAVSKDPGRAYNPLFIYGGVGLGKTHLLHAIGHLIRRNKESARVLYVTAERFINEFIDSLRFERMNHFRNKYRNLDCLMIDDVQHLVSTASSQEEFFYTFNTLYDSRKQVVICSDRPPKETRVGERLISRFEWGVITDIQPPDLETRIAILRKKAEAERLFVPDDVILFIASQIKSNIRELEGSLIRIVAFSSLTGTPLTIDSARETLKDIIKQDQNSRPVTIPHIQQVVASQFNLNIKDMKSRRRTDAIAFPRQVAMYLTRTLTECSTTEIGESYGGRDHTTVMHACEKIKQKMNSDPYFVALINKVTQRVREEATQNS